MMKSIVRNINNNKQSGRISRFLKNSEDVSCYYGKGRSEKTSEKQLTGFLDPSTLISEFEWTYKDSVNHFSKGHHIYVTASRVSGEDNRGVLTNQRSRLPPLNPYASAQLHCTVRI